MANKNLPTRFSGKSEPLWKDISSFSRNKYGLAALLIFIGMFGIIIPIIPGILFFVFAIALLKPGWMAKIRGKLNSIFKRV